MVWFIFHGIFFRMTIIVQYIFPPSSFSQLLSQTISESGTRRLDVQKNYIYNVALFMIKFHKNASSQHCVVGILCLPISLVLHRLQPLVRELTSKCMWCLLVHFGSATKNQVLVSKMIIISQYCVQYAEISRELKSMGESDIYPNYCYIGTGKFNFLYKWKQKVFLEAVMISL